TRSAPTTGARRRSRVRAASACASRATRMPRPNSALSSNSEFAHAGPRPALLVDHGVVGRLPPKIDEHPVALAIMARSPKSWVSNFRYGVSPHPAQAPENSNSGSRSWDAFTESWGRRERSRGGIEAKASQFARSRSRCSAAGSMSIDLWPLPSLAAAGQTCTHTPHPVQSSGATCTVSRWPGRSRDRNGLEGSTAADPEDPGVAPGVYTFMRMAAWGQTMAHLPQSMQIDGSHTGMSRAMERFSNTDVAVGKAPSTGRALTGRRSPSPASRRDVTRWTK